MLLQNQRLALLLKALVFGVFFAWTYPPGSSLMRGGIFVFTALILYIKPFFNILSLSRSFLALTALSLIFSAAGLSKEGVASPPSGATWATLLIFVHAILFFIILGLKEFVLVHRLFWHEALFAVLSYETIVIYSITAAAHPAAASIFLIAVIVALLSELVSRETDVPPRRAFLAGAVLGLMILTGLWVAKLLPLGFLNVSNLTALGALFFTEMLLRFYNNKLTKTILISRVIVFALLAAFIFLTSRWYL